MLISCPNCGRDVSHSEIEQRFGNELLPVFQCTDCMKFGCTAATTFVMLPGGTKVKPDDVSAELEKIGCGSKDIGQIISRAFSIEHPA